jgi:hypothetical protein
LKVAKKLYTKCLAILSGNERTIIVSTDFIGATPKITKDSFEKARRLGLRTELKNILFLLLTLIVVLEQLVKKI